MKKMLQHITHLNLEIGLLLAFMLGSVGLVCGQTQNMYWTFNQSNSNCPLNFLTQTPTNLNIAGSYTYTDLCSTMTGTTTSGSPFVSVSSAGYALQNYVPRPSYPNGTILSKSFVYQFSGSDLTNFSQFKIYFQFSRNSQNYSPQYIIEYSTNGTNYTTFATVTSLPSVNTWREESFDLSAVSALNGHNLTNLYFRITYSHARGSTSYTTTVAIDNFQVQGIYCALSTAPTSITGTTSICPGGSTILTTSGGSLGTDAKDVWYEGACATEAYTNEWATQPFTTPNTTVNSVAEGILNVTSLNNDPMIEMAGLGSFDPNTSRYIQIYYQVTSGNGSSAEIFFYNTTHNFAVGGEEVAGALISDGAWHFLNFDMWSDPDYKTGGNITGWRFDWAGESGVTMNIDFITLANQPLIGLGTSVTVSPATPATYFTRKKGGCNSTVCVSRLVTINADATLTLTSGNASPTVCKNNAITDIVFTVGGAGTAASVTSGSLPTGVTGTYNSTAKTFTISGIPTINATFPFTVTTSGSSCINPSLSGTITVNALPAFTKSFTDITCFDAGNGTITISATGGSGTGYEYSINGGSNWQTGGNYTGLGPATYTIKVKDSNNCIQTICQ